MNRTNMPGESDADVCRRKGWGVGTIVMGNEGYGDTYWQITAIGKHSVLAETVAGRGAPAGEHTVTFRFRDWRAVEQPDNEP